MRQSIYYQAYVQKELSWIVTATLRFSEHVAFDRTIDKEKGIFEFFVAPDLEDVFLDVIKKLVHKKVILQIQKLPNRLLVDQSI